MICESGIRGGTPGFQPGERGSTPLARSKFSPSSRVVRRMVATHVTGVQIPPWTPHKKVII